MTWLAANADETYAQYVTRLQGIGWLGTATKIVLDDNNGDSEFDASGVPCTSVAPGATIGANDPVTMYQNPATLGTGDPTTGVPACPGRLTTTRTGNKCEFHNVRWATHIAGNETFYNGACNDAWAYFWAKQTIFDTSGNTLDTGQVMQLIAGTDLHDAAVIAQFRRRSRPDTLGERNDDDLLRPFAYPFQIHFYWHLTDNTVRFDLDWKLKFNNVFTP